MVDRSGPGHANAGKDYWVVFDVKNEQTRIESATIIFNAVSEKIVKLPRPLKMKPGDEIITSLDVNEGGDWKRVGKEIHNESSTQM